jgi:hypothetical protein
MTAPLDALADRGRVDALVSSLQNLATTPDSIPITGSLAKFGLEPAGRRIRLYRKDGKQPLATLEVGAKVQDRQYVRSAETGLIDVIDAKLLGNLNAPASEWREHTLLDVFPFDVQSITVQRSDSKWEFDRTETGWRIAEPFRAPGDEKKVDGMLADLTGIQVADGSRGFVADDVRDFAPYGLDKPSMRIQLATRSADAAVAVDVGEAVPDEPGRVYARREDQDDVVEVDARSLAALGTDASAYRSAKVVDLEPAELQFLRVAAVGIEHELAKGDDGWHVLAPVPGKADTRAVQELLTGLAGLDAIPDVPEHARAGAVALAEPAVVISAWQGPSLSTDVPLSARKPARRADVTVRISRLEARRGVAYVQTEGDPTVLTVLESVKSLFPKGKLAYRDRVLMNIPMGTINDIVVERAGRKVEIVSAGGSTDRSAWRMILPVEAPADAPSVARLEPLLARMRAESLVAEAPADLKAYGLDQPEMIVSWKAGNAGTAVSQPVPAGGTYAVMVGRMVPDTRGSHFAKLGGDLSSLVFTLSPEALGILGVELHAHAVLSFPENQVVRVVLGWPGKSCAFRRHERPFASESDWEPEPGSEACGLDGQRVDALVKAVANLSTPRFAQYTGSFPSSAGLTKPRFRIEVQLSGGLDTRVLRIGEFGPEQACYATAETGDSGSVALLPASAWAIWINQPSNVDGLPANVFAPTK